MLLVVSAALVVLVFPVLQGLLEKPLEKWAADHALIIVALTLVVGVPAVVLTVKGLLGGGSGAAPGSLPQVMDRLARVVRTQWRDEAKSRDRDLYGRGALLPCYWSPTQREVTDRPGGETGSGRQRLDSALAVVEAYRRQSSPWLVVLGEAGAGKSTMAMLLTLGLLDARAAEPDAEGARPVPVLLTIASWDPKKESLETWLKRRLVEDYPFLRALPAADEHEDVLQRLLDDGRILPVLDGMDEIRVELRSEAITLIKGSGLPRLILTCRADEYEHAVVEGLDVLPDTATVELEPVEPADAIDFIPQGMNRRQRERWQPVLDDLAQRPDGPLAQAFSTPLMVSLALDVYRKRATGPEELAGFATRTGVETHLLDALIPTAFPERPAADRHGWKGDDVKRWLTHLAEAMRHHEVREIAWWELSRLAPRRLRILIGLVGGLISGGSAGLGVGVFTGHVVGRYVGQQAGAVTGWVAGVLVGAVLLVAMGRASASSTPKPSDLHFGVTGRGRAVLVSGLVVGLVGGGAGLLLGGVRGAVLAVLACLPIAFAYALAAPDATEEAVEPRRLLEQDRRVALIFGVVYALATGLVGGFGIDPLFGVVLGVVCGLAGGLLYGPVWAFSLEEGKAGVISWMHLCFVRLWLAPQGKLPWRVMAFLEEARNRNVLRQAGAVYQFRHASLQDALAGAPLKQENDPVRSQG